MICTLTKHYFGNQIKKNERVWHVACIGEKSCAYRGLVGKSEEKRLLPGRDRG
jgi:hypothetical protein